MATLLMVAFCHGATRRTLAERVDWRWECPGSGWAGSVERARIADEWEVYKRGEGDRPTPSEPQVVNEPPVRMQGHSKDKRPDKPQIVIGAIATAEGRLLRHRVYPGNRNDQTITLDLVQRVIRDDPAARPVVVMDSGMGGRPNLAAIDKLPGLPDRISAVPLRKDKFCEEEVLSKPGRWRRWSGRPHMQFRVVEVAAEASPSGRAELWIATRNKKEVDRVKRKLRSQQSRIEAVSPS